MILRCTIIFLVFLIFKDCHSEDVDDMYQSSPGKNWGGLYPYETPTRLVKSLDGIWNFRLSPLYDPNKGFREKWYKMPLAATGEVIPMAVPSSYNDLTESKEIRDHVGWAWYDTTFTLSPAWKASGQHFNIRFADLAYLNLFPNIIKIIIIY